MENILHLHEAFCDEALIIRNLSPRTVKWYKSDFFLFKKLSGIETLKDITQERLREFFIKGRLERKWSPERYHNLYKALKAFFKWCQKREYLAENPILKIEKPKLGKHLPKRISTENAKLLLDTIISMNYSYRFEKYRNHALFSLLLFTGLRSNEALSLDMADVNFEEDSILIRHGKGDRSRILPICERLKFSLQAYLRERERLNKKSSAFFVSLQGNKSFTYNGLKRVIDRLKEVSGIKFSAHRLRHTFATMMLEQGVDIFSVSKMLGHSDIKTTTIYLSASPEHLKKEINKHPLNNLERRPHPSNILIPSPPSPWF